MGKEYWRPVMTGGFELLYHISNYGRLKKLSKKSKCDPKKWLEEKIIAPKKTKKGYIRYSLLKLGKRRWFYAHRLVGLMFVGNPLNKPCINHKDAIKTNNYYENLEWCTDAENNEHARISGLFEGANSKIPKDQRKFIKENFFTLGRSKLAEMFGLSQDYILSVVKVKVNGTEYRKKCLPHYKKIVDVKTGKEYTSDEVAIILGIKRRYVHRMLSEERKLNLSQFRYA
jgi:hypothetical protein